MTKTTSNTGLQDRRGRREGKERKGKERKGEEREVKEREGKGGKERETKGREKQTVRNPFKMMISHGAWRGTPSNLG